jgi:hypothetical protein
MSRRRRLRRLITNTAIVIGTTALAGFAFAQGRDWVAARNQLAAMEQELVERRDENDEHRQLHAALQPKAFKVCNQRTDPVRIDWVYAAYPEGGELVTFDSSLCADWTSPEIGDGKTQVLLLNSAQPGCNWSGKVVFYAMSFTRADGTYLNVAGPWGVGFDRSPDCFVIP